LPGNLNVSHYTPLKFIIDVHLFELEMVNGVVTLNTVKVKLIRFIKYT
jgi:hypothetical protein